MEASWLLEDLSDGVLTFTFNRPDSRNAMTRELRAALHARLKEREQDAAVRIVVFRGAGGNFVAGGDVAAFAETLKLDATARQKNFVDRANDASGFVLTLVNFPKPVVAVVEGHVAGAGISLALASDFVLASESAQFTFAHAQIGLALDLGLSFLLPRTVGGLAAKRLSMLGERIGAAEARELGLVTTVVADDEVDAGLAKLVGRIRKISPAALTEIKAELVSSINNALSDQLNLEAQAVGRCAATEDFRQRVSAFVKK